MSYKIRFTSFIDDYNSVKIGEILLHIEHNCICSNFDTTVSVQTRLNYRIKTNINIDISNTYVIQFTFAGVLPGENHNTGAENSICCRLSLTNGQL